MTLSLRRSRRAPPKRDGYNVGDVVEVTRTGGVTLKGRLAQPLTAGASPNPRWLLKFDGQPHKDEEMYERSFGKLLFVAAEEESPSASTDETTTSKKRNGASSPLNNINSRKGSGRNIVSSSDTETAELNHRIKSSSPAPSSSLTNKKPSDYLNEGGSDDESETHGPDGKLLSEHDRGSARGARSRRRQAKIDDDPSDDDDTFGNINGKRHILPPSSGRSKKLRPADMGEPVKVKLLTGTLLLYRGRQRRVEFVRRV